MRGIHDHIVKELAMAFPDDFLRLTLPHVAAQVDLSKVEFISGKECFNEVLLDRRWYPDLVARMRKRSNPDEELQGHLEIEYRLRKLVRLRNYNHVLTVDSGLATHTGVVYLHGGPRGLQTKKYEEESCGRVPCTFRYDSLGLSRTAASKYLARPEPLAWALAVLMRPKGFASRAELALACLRRILGAERLDESRRFKLLNFVHTYAKIDTEVVPEYGALLRAAENQEVEEMLVTWADEMKAEGRREGKAEAIEKMRGVVVDLVAQRFGDLSERSRRAITAISSLDELAELARRVFQVHSLEELEIGS